MNTLTDKQFTLLYTFFDDMRHHVLDPEKARIARNLKRKGYLTEWPRVLARMSIFDLTDKGRAYIEHLSRLFDNDDTSHMTVEEREQYVLILDPDDSYDAEALYRLATLDGNAAVRYRAARKLAAADQLTDKGYEELASDRSKRVRMVGVQGLLANA